MLQTRKSVVNNKVEFDERNWAVSLINTGKGINSIFGGHAKIIVEGLKKNLTINPELFVGEYHIMEAEVFVEENWIPQSCRNTKCKYAVLITERHEYKEGKEEQYSKSTSITYLVQRNKVQQMIQNIKNEQMNNNPKEFQYAGNWCFYNYQGGHNCTTWAEEKLGLAGVHSSSNSLSSDSIKACPSSHVGSSGSSSRGSSSAGSNSSTSYPSHTGNSSYTGPCLIF